MPKTPACSPLKSAPVPRFTRSLLLSYADSPVQRGYVLPTDDTSDADEDDEDDDELDIRAASPAEAPDTSLQSPDTEATADEGGDRASARRNSWTSCSTAEASRSKSSVALRTLQSARQALVNAKRRSFELGERSVSVTFQQLRSCSLSTMRYSDNNDPGDATPGENNNANESSPSPAEAINASSNLEQLVEQQEQTEPEQPEQEDLKQPKQQQQKKKRRIRTASYQSALTKYLPVVFNRSTSTKSKTADTAGSGLNTNSSSASNDKNSERASNGSIDEEVNKHPAATTIVASPTSGLSSTSNASHDNNGEANNETASDTEDGTDKQGTGTTVTSSSSSTISAGRKFLRWPLRHHHYQNKEEPNDNQSEQSRSVAVSFVKQAQAESGK